MKTVGYKRPLPISDREALLDIELPIPETDKFSLSLLRSWFG
jgi:hypothetical protein